MTEGFTAAVQHYEGHGCENSMFASMVTNTLHNKYVVLMDKTGCVGVAHQ